MFVYNHISILVGNYTIKMKIVLLCIIYYENLYNETVTKYKTVRTLSLSLAHTHTHTHIHLSLSLYIYIYIYIYDGFSGWSWRKRAQQFG